MCVAMWREFLVFRPLKEYGSSMPEEAGGLIQEVRRCTILVHNAYSSSLKCGTYMWRHIRGFSASGHKKAKVQEPF